MGEDTIHYKATMDWRKPSTLLCGVLLSVIGSALLVWLIVQTPELIRHPKYLAGALFPLLIGGTFTWGGIGNLHYYLSAKAADLTVSDAGVSYGDQHFPWCEIGALSARRYGGKLQLLLHRRGRLAVDRPLESTEGISESAYRALMETLRLRISSNFPHVRFS